MSDRDTVVETINRLFWYVDRRQWGELQTVLADEVLLDYTSLSGGDPAGVSAPDIIAAWHASLGGLAATQHLVSNHLVTLDGDSAEVTAQFIATHLLPNSHGGPTWTLGGHYLFELQRTADENWRITAITMIATWATGNQHIMTLAAG